MAVRTVHLSAACWRLLNALERLNRPARMRTVCNEQDATDADVVGLEDAGLVAGTWYGTTTALQVGEHLARDGASMMVQLHLTSAGRRQLDEPRNRVLCLLGSRPRRAMPMRTLLNQVPGAAVLLFEQLVALRLVTVAHTVASEPVEQWMLRHLPAQNITVRLTDKGRIFLPL